MGEKNIKNNPFLEYKELTIETIEEIKDLESQISTLKKKVSEVNYPRFKHVGLNEIYSPEAFHSSLKAVD